MLPSKVLFLSDADVKYLYPMTKAIKVIEQAFKDYALQTSKMPPKVYLDLPKYHGDFRAMPAYCPSSHVAGIKWVNSHPNNAKKGIPTVMATMILNDPETAVPKAILAATELTAIRTGAAGGVAVKYLANKNAQTLALVGCGKQAYYQAIAIAQVRSIKTIHLVDNSAKTASSLAKTLKKELGFEPVVFKSVEKAVQNCEIIVTTTPSHKPIIKALWLSRGCHINAIGADAPTKQELDPMILKQAKLIVDDRVQAAHSGEINVPLAKKQISPQKVAATLGDIIIKKKKGRLNASQITVFDSTGLAIQDIASGGYLLTQVSKLKTKNYQYF